MSQTGETHFGFRMVDLAAKQRMVDAVFHRVARRYDLMNDLMSGGLHRFWKNAMVAMLNPPRNAGYTVVDVAGGTGDVAFRIAGAGAPDTRVTVCDISPDMLALGQERARARGREDVVH
ncbi:MAG: class I SAM-dependent methyltransferase, partial [Xanthobacteraceae bacterium]|nr:class I SAM-dependent methyltransferase [Xanthobacteraceae bacterium]